MKPDADGLYRIAWMMPTEEQIREQTRTALEGSPVYCYFAGYPPLPDERTLAYQRRVMSLVWREIYPPKLSLWQRLVDFLTARFNAFR